MLRTDYEPRNEYLEEDAPTTTEWQTPFRRSRDTVSQRDQHEFNQRGPLNDILRFQVPQAADKHTTLVCSVGIITITILGLPLNDHLLISVFALHPERRLSMISPSECSTDHVTSNRELYLMSNTECVPLVYGQPACQNSKATTKSRQRESCAHCNKHG